MTTYSVLRSDFSEDCAGSVLQKTSFEIDKCTVQVSEYKLEYDFFFQIPPDDHSKCQRKLILSFNIDKGVPTVNLEYWTINSVI